MCTAQEHLKDLRGKRCDMKKNNVAFICLTASFLLLATLITEGQHLKAKDWPTKQRMYVDVMSTIDKQIQCANGNISLSLSITVKNRQDSTLVFCKSCMNDEGSYISKNEEMLYQDKYEYDIDSLSDGPKYSFTDPDPNKPPFVAIKKGESFTFNIRPHLTNFSKRGSLLPAGNYVFIQTIETWKQTRNPDLGLKDRWTKDGLLLWENELITEPTLINVSSTSLEDCGN